MLCPKLSGFGTAKELASMVHKFSGRTMRGNGVLKTDPKGRQNEILTN